MKFVAITNNNTIIGRGDTKEEVLEKAKARIEDIEGCKTKKVFIYSNAEEYDVKHFLELIPPSQIEIIQEPHTPPTITIDNVIQGKATCRPSRYLKSRMRGD